MNLRLDGEAAQTDASLASGAPEAAGVLMIFLEPAPYIRAFVEAARDREATEVRSARGATIAGFLVKLGFSQTDTKEFVLPL